LAAGPYGRAAAAGTMAGMALMPISSAELAETPTLLNSFMGYVDRRNKTFGQLLAIYRERSKAIEPAEDEANDLRVERFMRDMAGNRWTSDLVLRIGEFDGTVLVIDGIHLGMAYLACVDAGISPDRLPALHVDR
jgi:hypothetical protein